MSFVVTEGCFDLGLRAGAIIFRNVKVGTTSPALLAEIETEIQRIRSRFDSVEAVRTAAEVLHFQTLLRRVGVNPRREQPSVERLLTSALKRGRLPAINSLVDAYNLVSIRSCCSLGAHDLDRLALPISLRILAGNEVFTPLGSD